MEKESVEFCERLGYDSEEIFRAKRRIRLDPHLSFSRRQMLLFIFEERKSQKKTSSPELEDESFVSEPFSSMTISSKEEEEESSTKAESSDEEGYDDIPEDISSSPLFPYLPMGSLISNLPPAVTFPDEKSGLNRFKFETDKIKIQEFPSSMQSRVDRLSLLLDVDQILFRLVASLPPSEVLSFILPVWQNEIRRQKKALHVTPQALRALLTHMRRPCKTCTVRDADVMFFPCGHVVSCQSCMHGVRICQHCQKVIRGTKVVIRT